MEFWRRAIELFEGGEYYECHEVLERVWLRTEGERREWYGGFILLAAALHKARVQGSPQIAQKIFARAIAHLSNLPDVYDGVRIRELERICQAGLSDAEVSVRVPFVDCKFDDRPKE